MKKAILFLLLLAMLLSMAACGENQSDPGETTNPQTNAPSESVSPSEPTAKTFYFCTQQTSISQALRSTTETTYDENGRLTGYSMTRSYPSMNTSSDISLSYEYSDSGAISQIIMTTGGQSVPLVASYEGEKLVGYYGEHDGERGGWRFSYNDDGRIETIYLAEDETEKAILSLGYYESGALQERIIQDQPYQITTKYNEAGKVIEQIAFDPASNTTLYRYLYEYDAQGNQVRQETYTMGSTEPASIMQMEYDAEGHCIKIEASGNGQSLQATGVWDAATKTMSFDMTGSPLGAIMESTYDDAGHVIGSKTMTADGTVVQQNTSTYIAMELPVDYEMPNVQDPVYLLFVLGIL